MKPWFLFLLCATAIAPATAADMMQYGRAYLAEGDNAAAAKSYGEVLRLNPFDPVALNNMAVAKAANGDYQTAIDLLARASKLAPNRADIRENYNNLKNWSDNVNGVSVMSLAATRPGIAAQRPSGQIPEPPPLWPAVRKSPGAAPVQQPVQQQQALPTRQ